MASPHNNHAAALESQRAEMNNGARTVFRKQFYKTEMCRYFKGGCAKGDSCSYAHGKEELRIPPDLWKTSLCRAWVSHSCPLSAEDCPFAHGWAEMRATPAFVEYGTRQSTRNRRGQTRPVEEPVIELPGEVPQAPSVLAEAEAADAASQGAGHASPAPGTPVAAAEAAGVLGLAVAVPAFALAPQVLMFRPAVVDMQQQASAQTLLQGLGAHLQVAFPEALHAGQGQALASRLQQAMPDHYED